MDTIEKAHAEVRVMVGAALDRRAFTAEEIMESVRDAMRVVHIEACWDCAPGPEGCPDRARIDALAQDGREQAQEEVP
jgi:NADH:ubiquinone oxidoreductase subunit F (NADH-binding)